MSQIPETAALAGGPARLAAEAWAVPDLRRIATEAAGVGVWQWDISTGELDWDEVTAQVFGVDLAVFDRRIDTFASRVHPDDLPHVQAAIAAALESGGDYREEFRIVRTDGTVRWIEGRGRVSPDPLTGAPVMRGVTIDTTDLRHAHDEIARRLEEIDEGFLAVNGAGVVTYANRAVETLLGVPRAALLGRSLPDGVPTLGDDVAAALTSRTADDDRSQRFEVHHAPRDVWLEVRLLTSPGGVAIYLSDVTARRAAEAERARLAAAERVARRRLDFLSEVSLALSSVLDRQEVARRLVDAAVPAVADWAVVFLAEGGHLRQVAARGADAGIDGALGALGAAPPLSVDAGLPVAQVFRTGEPQIHRDLPRDLGFPPGPLADAARALDTRVALFVPLTSRGRSLGVLAFASGPGGRDLDDDDVRLARDVAARAAVAIDNATAYERERSVADALQRAVLPEALPDVPRLRLAAGYRPSARGLPVSGDWYDVFVLPSGTVGVVVGDVAGHGLRAASLMGQLRNALRAYAFDGNGPAATLRRLNRLMSQLEPEAMATAVYLEIDAGRGLLRYASAGHPAPLLRPRRGRTYGLPVEPAPPLGVWVEDSDPAATVDGCIELAPGDRVAVFTDGLVERRGEDLSDGVRRLSRTLDAHAGASAVTACPTVLNGLLAEDQEDDVCLVLVDVEAMAESAVAEVGQPAKPAAADRLRMRLVPERDSVPRARAAVSSRLAEWGIGGTVAHATLIVVDELVSNAVVHGRGDIGVSLSRGEGRLFVEVADSSPMPPRRVVASRTDEVGRGLALVEALSRRWGTRVADDGKRVWAEIDLPPD